MDKARKWNVRFKLAGSDHYTFVTVKCKHEPLTRDEVQQWADTAVRTSPRYAAVDEIYPLQEGSGDE